MRAFSGLLLAALCWACVAVDDERVTASDAGKGSISQDDETGFSACLLTMDDNYRLIEWLAYHYYTMPLRKLVVMVDPRSVSSPSQVLARWQGYMDITVWSDQDVFTDEELADKSDDGLIKLHRLRQRAFNVKCMTELREQGATWTLMTDVDEYTYVNPRMREPNDALALEDFTPPAIHTPGSVIKTLRSLPSFSSGFPSPCLPVARLQFGGKESTESEIKNGFPEVELSAISPWDMDTFRWRYYGQDDITARNGILPGKTIIDLSQLDDDDVALFSGDPHRPVDKLCSPARVWQKESESYFIANHVLGTMEQYVSRQDSRIVDRIINYERRYRVDGNVSDETRSWLIGFVDQVGNTEAKRLLADVGKVNSATHQSPPAFTEQKVVQASCSLNFFGLPRSFETMVLPSLVENVLLPNAKYGCDIYVHYYENIFREEEGRFNRGGTLDPTSIRRLEDVARVVAAHVGTREPAVLFHSETKEEFYREFGPLIWHYETERDPQTDELVYFPWADKSYTEKQIENLVMQWHSIQSAWQLMMQASEQHGADPYERVAFLRSDVFFATPIDIFQVDDDTFDYSNEFAVIPGFGKHPVSDRMIYGPRDAVEIWATRRFDLLDDHISNYPLVGYGMHPERFLDHTIFPTIRAAGVSVVENSDICFFRTRANDSLLISDCLDGRSPVDAALDSSTNTATIDKNLSDLQLVVERIISRECVNTPFEKDNRRFVELRCDADARKERYTRRSRMMKSGSFSPTYFPSSAGPASTSAPSSGEEVITGGSKSGKSKAGGSPGKGMKSPKNSSV